MNNNLIDNNKINNFTPKYLFNKGERVFDTLKKQEGTINYLRNDSYEKELRKKDSTHFRYFIDYDDGSFDTYVSANFLYSLDN